MSGVLSGFTVIFIVVGIGYLLGRAKTLGDHAVATLSRLVFFVFTPALLFTALVTSDLAVIFSETLVIAGGSALLTGALYLVIARLWLRRAVPELMIGGLSASYVNSVNLGLPIAIFVLDDASFIAPLMLFQILVLSPIALTALDLSELRSRPGGSSRSVLRDAVITPLTNPIVAGGIAGLVVSLIGWQPPEAVMSPLTMLGEASVPCALLAFGLSLTGVQVLRKGESPRRDVALVVVLKSAVMPMVAYAIARWAFDLSGPELFAQVVIAALPTAQSVLVYATKYQRGQILSRDAALITTIAAIPALVIIAWLLA